jgi:hypothetical protein
MRLIIIILYFIPFGILSQWTELNAYTLPKDAVWEQDLIGNLYVAKGDLLVKYDTAGTVQYSQSFKSTGNIKNILPINTMKILLFSEEQQIFTLVDNTLSSTSRSYDLSDLDFGFVNLMAVSSQPNKVWVYDQLNSKLVLFDWGRTSQRQEINNIRGLLNSSEPTALFEDQQKLYLVNQQGIVFIFDIYGSLLDRIDLEGRQFLTVSNGTIFSKGVRGLELWSKPSRQFVQMDLPQKDFSRISWGHKILFLQNAEKLQKYKGNF